MNPLLKGLEGGKITRKVAPAWNDKGARCTPFFSRFLVRRYPSHRSFSMLFLTNPFLPKDVRFKLARVYLSSYMICMVGYSECKT
jgi:hypothetical protein